MTRNDRKTGSKDDLKPIEANNESTEQIPAQVQSNGVVEFGNATRLTKGSGGRRSETGYAMP